MQLFTVLPVLAASEEITVERIFGEPSIYNEIPSGISWAGKSKKISYLETIDADGEERTALVLRSVPSGKTRIVCLEDTIRVPEDLRKGDDDAFTLSSRYKWNRNGSELVFTFRGDIFTVRAKDGIVRRRTVTPESEKDPEFSPDGRMLAYTREHDLYTLDLDSGEENRLTETGSDSVLNGILDWVYMEELFTRGNVKSYFWSPDGSKLAFLEIREDPVPEFPLVDWIPVHATYELQHYPKAGDPCPIVRVGIVDANGGEIVWTDTDTSDDSYIARLYWLGDSRGVAIEKLNRAQDRLDLLFANTRNGKIEEVFAETHDTWVNVNYLKHYYENKRRFVWGSERDGHSHLYLYNMDGTEISQLTSGEWEVTSLNGVDEAHGKIYFTANEGDVRDRHLFVVDDKGVMRRITQEPGTHSVTMSPDFKYYIDRFSTHERPTRVSVHSVKGKEVFEVGDQMSDAIAQMDRPTPEFITIDADGRTYYASITKPLDFDPSKRYPVIVYVYGGPHAQVVRRTWSRHNLWHSMMAQKGYIIFSLDNRGSFGRGKAWEDAIIKNMGSVELEDQLIGVNYLKSLPYVDGDNIGIWGWSYGGYMTLISLFKAPDVFKAGTSVAPVSDWHLYDSIYTERYMKRPIDNPEGYETSSPLNYVDDFKGDLLLMHGDADDNVHAQNSFKLIRKMIDAGKDLDFMVYPRKTHGISGSANRVFLYRKMTRFFDRHLKQQPDRDPAVP